MNNTANLKASLNFRNVNLNNNLMRQTSLNFFLLSSFFTRHILNLTQAVLAHLPTSCNTGVKLNPANPTSPADRAGPVHVIGP